MSIAGSISRLAEYYRRHGLAATVLRFQIGVKRKLFAGRMAVFYCDLDSRYLSQVSLPAGCTVQRITALRDLAPEHLRQMTEYWNPEIARKHIIERFAKGASLWLLKFNDQLAGYGWSLRGSTIEPYYFPLGSEDAHLFDFYVFPDYRGRGINPSLVRHILLALASEQTGRAFIEAAEWNDAQLTSLAKTQFRRLGRVRSFTLFGRNVVSWAEQRPTLRAADKTSAAGMPLTSTGPSER
jgi:ribosomal protein S18 acetylase RimI-like enzyme